MPISIGPILGNPQAAVAAIFTTNETEPEPAAPITVQRFLGTAFLVYGWTVHFVTAKHVLAASQPDEQLILIFDSRDGLVRYPVEWTEDTDADLSVGRLSSVEAIELPGFMIAARRIHNADVCSFEHSGSGRTVNGQSMYTARFRKGHVVSDEDRSEYGYTTGCQVIEVSYPALKGASGAPVFMEGDLTVVGMMVENVDSELLPSQLLRTVDAEGNLIEEIRYTMPHGRAIGFRSLHALLDRYAA
jgi:hypothetical protein